MMDEEIRDAYMDFFLVLRRGYENLNKDYSGCEGTFAMTTAPRVTVDLFARREYLRLEKLNVPNLESLRGCLNALERELDIKITEEKVGGVG